MHCLRDTALRLLGALLLLLGTAACHDGPFDEPELPGGNPPVTATIAEVWQLAGASATTVTGDLTVSGIVTTSDSAFGFYHTLCIEEDGAALQLLAAVERLHADFPVGCRVTLRLRGLTLGRYRGLLQAGVHSEPGSYYAVDYLASPAALAAHLTRSGDPLQPVEPTRQTIESLTPERCGTLVRIEGLRYTPATEAGEGDAASTAGSGSDPAEGADPRPVWRGLHRFCDATGGAVYSYVRSGALFADEPLPAGRCSLTGILQYASGNYWIQLRDASDCLP